MSRWLLDFAERDGIAGFVRLELRDEERVAWYWAYLVGVPDVPGVLVVRDHEVTPPRPGQGLEIRADGLWAELWCETPGEHWTFGLESFGVRLDAPAEALRPGGEIGERVAVGLDLEWEVDGRGGGPAAGVVHGDVLVGRGRYPFDGRGRFYDSGDADPGAIADGAGGDGDGDGPGGETVATVFVPTGAGEFVERRLVRTLSSAGDALTWTYARRRIEDSSGESSIPGG